MIQVYRLFQTRFPIYKGYKIRIGQVVIRENKKEKKQVDENIQANRQIQLDALIVRTMKAKKKMSHTALINELFANVRFPLNANDAKKRIEKLIEQEFIGRVEVDGQPGYDYIS